MSEKGKVTRREFIKSGAAATAAVAAGGLLASTAATPAMAAGVPDKWDKEYDIVVVGTGHAGLAAAITAFDAGAKVVILEKMPQKYEGGNSKVSGNMWFTLKDANEGLKYLTAAAIGLTDKESLQVLAEGYTKVNAWLEKQGVKPHARTTGSFDPEHPELPSGSAVATYDNGGTGNGLLYLPLRAAVTKRNIEVLYETPAKDLVQNPTSKEILGVKAYSGGKDLFIKAKKGVVLACGGFEFNFEMMSQFLPGWPIYGRGTPANTGDGIVMAAKAGAQLWHMNNSLAGLGCHIFEDMVVDGYKNVMMTASMPANGYVYVNKLGKRFMNEKRASRHGFGHKEYLLQFDGIEGDFLQLPCYGILDETTRLKGALGGSSAGASGMKFGWFSWFGNYQWSADNGKEIEKGWIIKANTLAELATKLGIKGKGLEETVAKYNEYVKSGEDKDFARAKDTLVAVEKPPFYAVKLFPCTYNTQGGPKRNAKCQVVDWENNPIGRLYSAGELGSWWGWMYNGGGNNGECFVTGQIAATQAAALKPWDAAG